MCRRNGSGIAWAAVIVGGLILLGLLLPPWLWKLVCGLALAGGGFFLLRCR